jgi:hypothetical protein
VGAETWRQSPILTPSLDPLRKSAGSRPQRSADSSLDGALAAVTNGDGVFLYSLTGATPEYGSSISVGGGSASSATGVTLLPAGVALGGPLSWSELLLDDAGEPCTACTYAAIANRLGMPVADVTGDPVNTLSGRA